MTVTLALSPFTLITEILPLPFSATIKLEAGTRVGGAEDGMTRQSVLLGVSSRA